VVFRGAALDRTVLREFPARSTRLGGAGQREPMAGIAWLKVTDPAARLLLVPPVLRVLLPDTDDFAVTAEEFSAAGAQLT
jgi:hypothetical protein